MVEKVRRLALLIPAQVCLDVSDKFGEGVGEAGHDGKMTLSTLRIFALTLKANLWRPLNLPVNGAEILTWLEMD